MLLRRSLFAALLAALVALVAGQCSPMQMDEFFIVTDSVYTSPGTCPTTPSVPMQSVLGLTQFRVDASGCPFSIQESGVPDNSFLNSFYVTPRFTVASADSFIGFIPNHPTSNIASGDSYSRLQWYTNGDITLDKVEGVGPPDTTNGTTFAMTADNEYEMVYDFSEKCQTTWIREAGSVDYTRVLNSPRFPPVTLYNSVASDTLAVIEQNMDVTTLLGPFPTVASMGYGTEACISHPTTFQVSFFYDATCNSLVSVDLTFTTGTSSFTLPTQNVPVSEFGNRFEIYEFASTTVPAGEYSVGIAIQSGASNIATYTVPYVTVNRQFTANLNLPEIRCGTYQVSWCADDGFIGIVPEGGAGDDDPSKYGYVVTRNGNAIVGQTDLTENLDAAEYTARTFDCHDCSVTFNDIEFFKMPDPDVDFTIECGATITVSASTCLSDTAFTFDWFLADGTVFTDMNTVTDVLPGIHTVNIEDDILGCSRNYTVEVLPFSFTAPYTRTTPPCFEANSIIPINIYDRLTCNTDDYIIEVDFGDGTPLETYSAGSIGVDLNQATAEGIIFLSHKYNITITSYVINICVTAPVYAATGTSRFCQDYDLQMTYASGMVYEPRQLDPRKPFDVVYWTMYFPMVSRWEIDSSLLDIYSRIEIQLIEDDTLTPDIGIATDPIFPIRFGRVNGTAIWFPHHLRQGFYTHYTLLLPGRCILFDPRTIYLQVADHPE